MDIVYFDFCKTFDSVPHQRLLLKLRAYGIQCDLLRWLLDFLIGIFAIYVNDLPQVIDTRIALFTDDTKLYHRITSDFDSFQLQKDIDNFLEWTQL